MLERSYYCTVNEYHFFHVRKELKLKKKKQQAKETCNGSK